MLERALDVVFPRRCAGCGEGSWPFCARCSDALVALEPPWCERCGHPWHTPFETCRECPPASIGLSRAAFHYDGPAKRAVHRLKFSGWRDVAWALSAAMSVALGEAPADVITWVPLARRRLAERGFDQARALATALGRRRGTPVVRLLRRTVASGPQARRGAAERRAAMAGAFAATRDVEGRVLLVDDVLTTGATAAACAQALIEAGAGRVDLAVAARSMDLRSLSLRGRAADVYARMGSRSGLWLPGDPPR